MIPGIAATTCAESTCLATPGRSQRWRSNSHPKCRTPSRVEILLVPRAIASKHRPGMEDANLVVSVEIDEKKQKVVNAGEEAETY